MKRSFIVTCIIFIIVLGLYVVKVGELNSKIATLTNNVNAYELELSGLNDQVGVYQMSIDEIRYSKDSIVQELNKARKELGIKDKQINSMMGFSTVIRDTVIIKVENGEAEETGEIGRISCDFEEELVFNEMTKVQVSLKGGELTGVIDVSDSFKIYDYSRKEWKEPKFFNRLILFRWGKWTYYEYKMVNDNELNVIKDFKVIKIQ